MQLDEITSIWQLINNHKRPSLKQFLCGGLLPVSVFLAQISERRSPGLLSGVLSTWGLSKDFSVELMAMRSSLAWKSQALAAVAVDSLHRDAFTATIRVDKTFIASHETEKDHNKVKKKPIWSQSLCNSILIYLLERLVLSHVLLVKLLQKVMHHAWLRVQQHVPPVVSRHHAVLQEKQQVPQECVHVQHLTHGWSHSDHVQLKSEEVNYKIWGCSCHHKLSSYHTLPWLSTPTRAREVQENWRALKCSVGPPALWRLMAGSSPTRWEEPEEP